MERPKYIKCPRCELNYIDANKQEYCDVCLKEMHGKHDDFDDLDVEDEELMEPCPICGENMMRIGEDMCEECKKKHETDSDEPDPEQDDEWRNYLDEEPEETVELDGLPPEDIIDEDEEEKDDEEEESKDDEVDDYVTGDEIYALGDDDDDDDDDDSFDDDDFDAGVKKASRGRKKKKSNDDDF